MGQRPPWTSEWMRSRPIVEVPRKPVVEGGRAWGERTRGPLSEAKPQSKEPNWVPILVMRSWVQTEPNEVTSFHGRST